MLNKKIIEYIERVNLVDEYKRLSAKYREPSKELMEKIDLQVVQDIISDLGYSAKYFKREQFFKVIIDKDDEMEIGYNISLKYGLVELIICIMENGKCLEGSPICFIISQYTGDEVLIKKPGFSNYTELKDILQYMFDMLKKFKEEK